MNIPGALRQFLSHPRYTAAALSLFIHLLAVLLASDHEITQQKTKDREKKRQLARIKLQVIPLAPVAAAPATVQIFREDLFKDTTDEEKNLFKLRKTEDARRKITINQDHNMRDLLKNPGRYGSPTAGTNAVYAFYVLDNDPRPLTDHISRIPFPDRARALGIKTFSLAFEAVINRKGHVLSSKLMTNGDYGFGDALLTALSNTRYTTGKINGKAVRYLLRGRALFTDGDTR